MSEVSTEQSSSTPAELRRSRVRAALANLFIGDALSGDPMGIIITVCKQVKTRVANSSTGDKNCVVVADLTSQRIEQLSGRF